jgi:hypothetical protein
MTEVELREQVKLDAKVLDDPLWQGKRITNMLNQAQRWLQLKLIKQGSMDWKRNVSKGLSNSAYQGNNTSLVEPITDRLRDMPIEAVLPDTTAVKPAKEVKLNNFYEVKSNTVLAPTADAPIFIMVDDSIHIYPRSIDTDAYVTYTKIVPSLTFNNSSTESEIPLESQEIIIERVVMQIKSADGDEQVKQAKYAEIDRELTNKYQLDTLKTEIVDKEATQ